jgi:hypothetical protein
MPEEISLKEERFILSDSFGGFSPWSLGSIVSGPGVRWISGQKGMRRRDDDLLVSRKQRMKKGTRHYFTKACPQ